MRWTLTEVERFESKIDKSGDCWLWTGTIRADGYGAFYRSGSAGSSLAHRFSYELLVGPIPDGLTLDHLCRVTRCVNPEHLEPVTNAVNILRGTAFTAVNARKTHCDNGHEYTLESTDLSEGHRRCRICRKVGLRARYYMRVHGVLPPDIPDWAVRDRPIATKYPGRRPPIRLGRPYDPMISAPP